MENPKCGRCDCYWKPENTDIKSSGLYYKLCKTCRNKEKQRREDNRKELSERSKIFRQDNKHKIRDYMKKYRNANREQISKSNKRYIKDNHEKLVEKHRQFYKNNKCSHERNKYQCKECNFKKYLIHLQRSQLRRCLKNSNLKKTRPSIEYLGCSAEYFMEYFKKKMDKFNLFSEIEMTWSTIHIDHIKPMSVFDLDNQDEFTNCSNYTNLQPLLAEMNRKKNNQWNDVSNDFWLTSIINNEDADIYIP